MNITIGLYPTEKASDFFSFAKELTRKYNRAVFGMGTGVASLLQTTKKSAIKNPVPKKGTGI
jgi:hypothetical protein